MKKLKALINKMIDIPKLIITIWLLLWVILFMLVAFKFCFNIWYPIVVENEKFISVCNFIDNVPIIRHLILFVLYSFSANVIFLTSINRIKHHKKWHFILLNILIVCSFVVKIFSNLIGVLIELSFTFILPIILNLKYKPLKTNFFNILLPLIIYALINLWQSNMAFIRNINEIITTLPTFVVLILQIDYYVYILITWIGVTYIMGLASIGWWWSRQLTKYEAYKEKELKKANPDMDYVNYCDSKIKECKEKLNEIKK